MLRNFWRLLMRRLSFDLPKSKIIPLPAIYRVKMSLMQGRPNSFNFHHLAFIKVR